jgi:hypothetical protein
MSNLKTITKQIPNQRTRAEFKAESFNEADRTVEVIFATETPVRMHDYEEGYIDEVLMCNAENCDLTRLNSGAPALDNHNRYGDTAKNVVGVISDARFENGQGIAKIRFGMSDSDTDLMNKVRDKIVTGVSVGYNVYEYQVTRGEGMKPLYRATSWEGTEISFTPVQADRNSRVRSEDQTNEVVIIEEITEEEPVIPAVIEPIIEEENNININTPEMTEEEKAAAALAASAKDSATRSAAIAEEQARIKGITSHCRALGLDQSVADALITENVDLATAVTRNLAAWEKAQPANPNPTAQQVHNDAEKTRSAMSNSLVLRASPRSAAVMGEENVRAASEFRGMSLLRLAEETLTRSGVNTKGLSNRQIARAALGGKIRGAHHTSDFPLLLIDSFTRTLRAAYALYPRTFEPWTRRDTLPDFREITRVQISGLVGNFDEVQELGEYKAGTFNTASEKYKLLKYGKIVGISYEAIMNDDLSAFTRIPQAFSQKSAQKQSDLVYAIMTGNPTMGDGILLWNAATHKNYTAVGTALSEASLDIAFQTFRAQKSIEGDFLNLTPSFLIVGPKNELVANKLTSQNFVPATQAAIAVERLTGLQLIIEPRITDYAFFLVANPAVIDTIEYSFLAGEEELFIEEEETFNSDSLNIKARMVFGTKAIDWRGMYKNNGAA